MTIKPFAPLPFAPLLLAVAATPVAAAPGAPFTDPAQIDGAVMQFTGVPVGAPGGAAQGVDRRLKLAACRNPLSLGWYGGRRDTVVVQCPDPGSWRLFVPLLQSAASGKSGASAVVRGEAVTIAVQGAGFSVSQPGEALDSGAVNDWIRVKPAAAGAQALRARIVRPGLVAVDLGSDLP